MSVSSHELAQVSRYLTAETVERISRPTAEATGLPNEAFTEPEFLALEKRLLFRRTWMAAGFVHELASPGDVMPTTVGDVPILLVHGTDGNIKAFHNVCRHRGTELVTETKRGVSRISCPYHGWTYDLEGRLRRRAHFSGPERDGEVDGIGLYPVRCEVWSPIIFVNIDGSAPPLKEFLSPVCRQLQGYDISTLAHAGDMTWEIESNWKFTYENYIEPYHVPWCHPALESFTPANQHWFSVDGPCFVNRAEFSGGEAGRGAGLPYLPHLSTKLRQRGTYIHLFPSCCLNLYPDHLAVFQLTPLSPHRTLERIALFLPEESLDPKWDEGRQALRDVWHELNEEDIGIVERQQRGRASPAFEGGTLSPYWDGSTTHAFAKKVVEGMTA